MNKRIIYGHLIVLSSVVMGIAGTFLLDYLERFTQHTERLELVFGIAGAVMGFASVMAAIFMYTNNMGNGFKSN